MPEIFWMIHLNQNGWNPADRIQKELGSVFLVQTWTDRIFADFIKGCFPPFLLSPGNETIVKGDNGNWSLNMFAE